MLERASKTKARTGDVNTLSKYVDQFIANGAAINTDWINIVGGALPSGMLQRSEYRIKNGMVTLGVKFVIVEEATFSSLSNAVPADAARAADLPNTQFWFFLNYKGTALSARLSEDGSIQIVTDGVTIDQYSNIDGSVVYPLD